MVKSVFQYLDIQAVLSKTCSSPERIMIKRKGLFRACYSSSYSCKQPCCLQAARPDRQPILDPASGKGYGYLNQYRQEITVTEPIQMKYFILPYDVDLCQAK